VRQAEFYLPTGFHIEPEFLSANTWEQRRDGVPLDLLDNLTDEELKTAEIELIKVASLQDNWPIIGLGHIKSKGALPVLYDLLDRSKGGMKVTIAHSIFQICQDTKMIEIVLETMPGITDEFEIIDVLYYLPSFKDKRITDLLHSYRNHKEYLVAYNATRCLGLPIDEVVEKFRNTKEQKSIWDKLMGK
jgi:hypothetical protein